MAYYIQDNCVACLKCKVECPVGAIHITEDRPVIDENTCVSCGRCAQVCKECAPINLNAPPEKTATHELIELDCDVLVLGGGGAGMVAAARAAEKPGTKVVVVEKQHRTGGGAWYAADFKLFRSRWQKERNLPDVMEEDMLRAMDATYWKLDPQLVRRCFEATGAFFDWLCDTGDHVENQFREGHYIFDGPNGPVVPVFKKMRHGAQGGTGKFVMDQMLSLCEQRGVTILTDTAAQELIAENGRVISALCRDAGGMVRINCRSCVLAIGSWIENQQVLERVDPKFAAMEKVRSAHRSTAYTGDGIKLAQQVGAKLDWDSFCLRLMGPLYMPADNTPYPVFGAMTFDPSVVQVNEQGERWCNEQMGSRGNFFGQAIPLRDQPHGVSFKIFDAGCIENAVERSRSGEQAGPFPMPPLPENWQDDIENALKEYNLAFKKADTIAELAVVCGIDPAALTATVERYNQLCDAGCDTDFCKTPDGLTPLRNAPFYALRCTMATDGAFGGVPVNADMKAYAENGGLIENLYVTGDFASGRFINQGGVKVQVINDLAWAFASGFIAGEQAANGLN
jgi:fumarate reductase flavoprotein subunit